MANPVRGEVSFQADGKDYVLLLDFNALCELDDLVPGLMDGGAELRSPSAIRAVFHAALHEHHPEIDLRGAGRLISVVGVERVAALIGEAMTASFGKEDREAADPLKKTRR